MRVILSLIFGSLLSVSAYADSWRDYLQIHCEPSIAHFSVRPTGTWNFDAEPPIGFVPIDNGFSYPENSSIRTKADGSDVFARCELSDVYSGRQFSTLVFEVVRTEVYEPAHCGGCGAWNAEFEVRLNGHVLEDGGVGGRRSGFKSVVFDGDRILRCDNPTESYRLGPGEINVRLDCQSSRLSDLLPE